MDQPSSATDLADRHRRHRSAAPPAAAPSGSAAAAQGAALSPAVVLLLEAAALLALLAGLLLAWLWLQRHPHLTAWDELGHITHGLADATALRQGGPGALRDALFLRDRWLPPGLRLVSMPLALAFWPVATEAMRVAAAIMFVAAGALLWLALRPLAGRAGAAAGLLVFALAPINLAGAQNFMTEALLNLLAAAALVLMVHEALAPRTTSPWRLALLGLVLGWGLLTKLTFLPTLGLLWLGILGVAWWRDRDATALALRLLVPAIGVLLVAWPHYALNGARYLDYARASAAGFAAGSWTETGLDFLARATTALAANVLGPGGTVMLLAGLILLALAWRRAGPAARLLAGLGLLAALPGLAAFLLSHNQTERYLNLTVMALALPVAVGLGGRFAGAGARRAAAVLGGVAGVAALAQTAALVAIALRGPAPEGWRIAQALSAASWRPNYDCAFTPVTGLVPAAADPAPVALFGATLAVNSVTIRHAFWRQGRPVQVEDLALHGADPIDWAEVDAAVAGAALLLLPASLEGADALPYLSNRNLPAFRARLAAMPGMQDLGVVQAGTEAICAVQAFRPPAPLPGTARRPLQRETHLPP